MCSIETVNGREYKVKDMAMADFGRLEIELAQVEMPGLMSMIKEFGPAQPLKGANISGSLHMTIQTAVLIETLVALGAVVVCVQHQRDPPPRGTRRLPARLASAASAP